MLEGTATIWSTDLEADAPLTAASQKTQSVLVVDDYEDTRELLDSLLTSAGYVVYTAENAERGLALAVERRPNVVLMDISMPGIDGFEATERLRADPTLADVRVVAYTARLSPLQHKKYLFDAVCVKPCPPAELLAVLERVLR